MQSICLSTHFHTLLSAEPRGGGEKCCGKPPFALQRVCVGGRQTPAESCRSHESSNCWSLTSTETSSTASNTNIGSTPMARPRGAAWPGRTGQSMIPELWSICFLTFYVFTQEGEVKVNLTAEWGSSATEVRISD